MRHVAMQGNEAGPAFLGHCQEYPQDTLPVLAQNGLGVYVGQALGRSEQGKGARGVWLLQRCKSGEGGDWCTLP